ncbi:hypothetical protein KVR01_000772 [Diaporthe batatas]|uniref:uncharacterized protein n=1 Tax=Diaporthe batatas TaxID=748121 RepID=UPI001D04DF87|nr:uncharacterized protein KVR01_000772 [Diaporthe batatas]KAG8170027.1 hypothetical protein KVR01_000772 [Diaporthe batatas]
MADTGPDLRDSPTSSTSSSLSHASAWGDAWANDSGQCTDYSTVFPGEWKSEDAAALRGLGWASRSLEVAQRVFNPASVPYWTRQDWDPNYEHSVDGTKRRRTRGDIWHRLRPAILPRDSNIPRTDYTRRWGINPAFPNTAEGLARSGLSPITAAPAADGPRKWTHEESWQKWWFVGFTSQELIDTGAYAPDWDDPNGSDSLSQRPDDVLHPLFERSRWEQPRTRDGLGGSSRTMNFDLIYDLNGRQGRYDAETDDRVWAALRPSMQLATMVINSGHPTFNMFLEGFYHMRRVPMDRDGRTDEEKQNPLYRQFRALWHEIDEREMYDHARELRRLGFDARGATLAHLQSPPLVGHNQTVLDFFATAGKILMNQNQHLIQSWLHRTCFDMVGAKVMRLRLHYERKTWEDKYDGIMTKCIQVRNESYSARRNIANEVAGLPTGNDPHTHLNNLIRQEIPELHRLMDHESRYCQAIAAEYFLKDLDGRNLVRRSMHALLRHLQTILSHFDDALQEIFLLQSDMGDRPGFTERADECGTLYRLLDTTKDALSDVIAILSGNTLDQREGTHGPLAAVPTCSREISNGRNLRIAALREFAMIEDPRLKRLIQTFINILNFTQDIRLDDPSAEDYVVGGGTIAELKRATDQATADALAISLLDRVDMARTAREAGTAPEEGEEAAIAEIGRALANLEVSSGIPDLYAAFSEDERNRIQQAMRPNP